MESTVRPGVAAPQGTVDSFCARDLSRCNDLGTLRGLPVNEACRWEEDYWELFAGAGPDIPDEQKRIVGLGMLLASDPSLAPVLDLKAGDGIWREDKSEWHVWERRGGSEPA